jgi:hypothetical protein
MIKITFYAAVLFLLLCLAGCKKAEDIKTSAVKPEVVMYDATIDKNSGARNIRTKVVHLYNDTVYILNEPFERQGGEQLIIDEGTLIKVGRALSNSGDIIVKPGGLITANGTAAAPIVFTINQPAGSQTSNWDGITIKGKSFNNANGTSGDAGDFSGVLNFVRIEFGNLTLEGVGSKTIIENIMVSYANPQMLDYGNPPLPAIGIYGGTFNSRNLIVYANGGPADFYITNGYTGTMQNIIACRHPFFGNAGYSPYDFLAGIVIENNANNPAAKPVTNPVISNVTVIGPNGQNGSAAAYADTGIRAGALVTVNNSRFQIRNSVFMGYPAGGWYLNDSITGTSLLDSTSQLRYCVLHSNLPGRVAYLKPGTVSNYTSADLKNFVLRTYFNNKIFNNAVDFALQDITNYDTGPNLMPTDSSPLLGGANFNGLVYSNNNYLDKNVKYTGALGNSNWLLGWTNFIPLKTNYNFAR